MKFPLLVFILLLSSCVSSSVTRYYDNKLLQSGKTFTILPFEDQKHNLEYKHYGNLIASKLESKGFRFVPRASEADYGVRFDYGVDNQKERIGNLSDDNYLRRTRYKFAHHKNYYSRRSYRNYIFDSLFYPQPYYLETYTRFLIVDIIDLKKSDIKNPIKLFEGELSSVGSCNSFSQVGNCLIDGMFKDFPGSNGKTSNIFINCNSGFCN